MELLAGSFTYWVLRRDVSEAPEFRQSVACIYLEGRVSYIHYISKRSRESDFFFFKEVRLMCFSVGVHFVPAYKSGDSVSCQDLNGHAMGT